MADITLDQRPHKKRRFFVDDEPEQDHEEPPTFAAETSSVHETATLPTAPTLERQPSNVKKPGKFDRKAFGAFVGTHIAMHTGKVLQHRYGSNMEAAVNAWFDGTFDRNLVDEASASDSSVDSAFEQVFGQPSRKSASTENATRTPATKQGTKPALLGKTPVKRYIGALGVAGWTTTSGTGLLKPGDEVRIERVKQQAVQKPGRGGKTRQVIRKTQDLIVRFTNMRGSEIGRLEKESAAWVSTLVDQKLCTFEGHCVYAPERIRTNETIFLQLRCYLLKSAFESTNFIKPTESNRETSIFEAKESTDERDL
ncbi:DNA helicase rad5, partial [Oleoguttula sp. CCFEE 5521]